MKRKRKIWSYMGEKCPVDGCSEDKRDIGYCGKHAQRLRRYGDPLYVTSESKRRESNRAAQPRLGKAKKTTYYKYFGRHKHRAIAEEKIGRKLKPGEIVHHINGDIHDNSPENLQVMTQSEHIKLHREEMQKAKNKCR